MFSSLSLIGLHKKNYTTHIYFIDNKGRAAISRNRFFFQITTGKLGIDLERTLVIHDEKNPNIWKTEVEWSLI